MKTKIKIISVALFLVLLISGIAPLSAAEGHEDSLRKAECFLEEILAFKMDNAGVDFEQGLVDSLADEAGISAEWYIIALSQSGEYDLSEYEAALCRYLKEKEVYSASSRLKYALTLAALGSTDDYIGTVLQNSIGKQGIMSLVFGLHLLNNGYKNQTYPSQEIIESLLSLQCEDGGWSLTGDVGNADVTAMTLQALAPHCKSNADVSKSAEGALGFLSSAQLESGGFLSYGKENAESIAQVIIALSSLGIDFQTDERFIKNGVTLLSAIETFRLPSGAFSHTKDASFDESATAQVFCAMVSYIRFAEGKNAFYILDKCDPEGLEMPEETQVSDTTSDFSEAPESNAITGMGEGCGYKKTAIIALLVIGAFGAITMLALGKRNYKNYIVLCFLLAASILFVLLSNFKTAKDYYNGEAIEKKNTIGSVTISIRCDRIVGLSDEAHIPEDGIILDDFQLDIAEGETVYDILAEASRVNGIQFENNGTESLAYIVGIGYIYEMQFGDLSGWVYHVNGSSPSVGCGEYRLSDGDRIEWIYTLDFGGDAK